MEIQSHFLWNVFIGTFLLIVSFSVVYYLLVICMRHNGRRKSDRKICDGYQNIPDSIRILFYSLLDRRQSSIENYIIFQITTKVFGFTGVLYSVYGFGLNFIDASKELTTSVSLLSLICVIIALYLSPNQRITEYIFAWRGYDKLVTDMIGKFPFYDGKPGNSPDVLRVLAKISEEVSKIECSIKSDET